MERTVQDMESTVLNFIDKEINPELLKHHGWIELERITDHNVYIRFRGACHECSSIYDTFHTLVRPKLLAAVPEIKDVTIVDEVSDEMLDFARSLFTRQV
ncbi:MAG: NifU family protein [Intestinimonas sp.]|nr:NifU family protein [Intestinimonas sp.]